MAVCGCNFRCEGSVVAVELFQFCVVENPDSAVVVVVMMFLIAEAVAGVFHVG